MIIWIAPVLLWLSGKAQDYVDFLRSVPSLIAPKPVGLNPPYVPPFQGAQCNTSYSFSFTQTAPNDAPTFYDGTRTRRIDRLDLGNSIYGRATGIDVGSYGGYVAKLRVAYINSSNQTAFTVAATGGADYGSVVYTYTDIVFVRLDGLPDNCGSLGSSTTPPSIPDDGLFSPTNPLIADENGTVNPSAIVLAPAFPLALVAAILAGYQAAMQAAQAALAALDAIKKIAEGLEALKDLWEKLREFLNEWEKNRPKKRDTVRQTYGQLIGDGALDFFPSNNQKYQSIQLDIVITTIPIGFGKYFGSFSPHRYRYKELGYIAFYSSTQGILEVRALEFKRTSLQIPKLAVGFIYHLGLNDQIKGYAFGTFSVEKP